MGGATWRGHSAADMFREADLRSCGKLSYEDFVEHMKRPTEQSGRTMWLRTDKVEEAWRNAMAKGAAANRDHLPALLLQAGCRRRSLDFGRTPYRDLSDDKRIRSK